MKKITIILLALLLTTVAWNVNAQEEAPDVEETEEAIEEIEESHEETIEIEVPVFEGTKSKKKRVKTRWFLLDVGISTYLHDGQFNLPADLDTFSQNYVRSTNLNVHIFKQRIGLIGNNLNLMYGLSWDVMCYNFVNDFDFETVDGMLHTVAPDDTRAPYRRNRLYTSFVEVPLMLNLETNPQKPGRSFRLSAGGYAGFLLAANQRTKPENRDQPTSKVSDDFNLNTFRYGVVGQIGYGPFTFYANYALNGMFKEGQGPSLTPINIGLVLVPF